MEGWRSLHRGSRLLIEAIGGTGEVVRQCAHHLPGVGHVDLMARDEAGYVVGIDAPREVMPRGDRQECACVVIVSGEVVDNGGFVQVILLFTHVYYVYYGPNGL